MKKVTFLSRVAAQNLVPPKDAVIISIHDCSQSAAFLKEGWLDRLTLEFHDTDGTAMGLTVFNEAMSKQVWDFLEQHKKTCSELFVHCQMGESRSGAVALVAAETYNVPCFKGSMPATWQNHTIYNRKVYRELLNWWADNLL